MRFMILVKATEQSEAGVMPAEAEFAAMGKFNEELVTSGVLLAGEGLHPSRTGARVVLSGDKRVVLDGPFAETKELLAGFWLIDVKSAEEALEWAKRVPGPPRGEMIVEVRRVYEPDDFGDAISPQLREAEQRLRARAAGENG